MIHPEFEKEQINPEASILPVYRTIKGISQKDLRRISRFALSQDITVTETLPEKLIRHKNICSREFALKNIHFPADKMSLRMANRPAGFEELYIFQTGLLLRGSTRAQFRRGIEFPHDRSIYEFAERLPYELTDAQAAGAA